MKTFKDLETGLEWEYDIGKRMSWLQSISYSKKKGNGWRVPTTQELLTLIDRSTYFPACSKNIETRSLGYWSSTPFSPDTESAWVVYFEYGNVGSSRKTVRRHTRLVRAMERKQ